MIGGPALGLLLLQGAVILAVARIVAVVLGRTGQPAVVGEMLGGILLGPSLFGWLFPHAFVALFPARSVGLLQLFSQAGVVLYMFLVGCAFDLGRVRGNARAAVVVSPAGIAAPFLLGAAAASFVFRRFAGASATFLPFALFVGTAMSVTAFPVLARIIAERRLTHTVLGTTALACAAVDDVTAWCLLSVVVAVARAAGLGRAALTLGLSLTFALLMLLVARPLASRWRAASRAGAEAVFVAALLFALLSALTTDAIGVHAIFGAFLAGVVVSANVPARSVIERRLGGLASTLLVPLFFASAGLRTDVTLLSGARSWLACAAIVVVAIAGKLGGGAVAARWTGMTWRDSIALGALMNTRGLMELIVLNVGYELGILSTALFSMMVVMALVTTMMTAPILRRLGT